MFKSTKIVVQHAHDDCGQENANSENVPLNVNVSKFVLFFSRLRSAGGRKYKHAGDDEVLAPLARTVEIKTEEGAFKPQPPPLPYRLTFKNRKSSRNPWSGHKTVVYNLGFNSVNIQVQIETFASGLRRVFVNGEEVVRQQVPSGDWDFSHFFTDQSTYNPSHKRLGTVLKVVVKEDQSVTLFADGFPAEKLRRSSDVMKGSPPPPISAEDVDTLDLSEVSRLTVT